MQRRRRALNINSEDLLAYLTYAIFAAAVLAVALTTGCGKQVPSEPVQIQGDANETGQAITEPIYEIPIEQVKDKDMPAVPGKDIDDIVAYVVVPPSDKPTPVLVHKRPKTITKKMREVITGTKGSPDYSVTSGNKSIEVKETREVGLWPWIVGLLTVAGGIVAAWKWLKRLSWIAKIMAWMGW